MAAVSSVLPSPLAPNVFTSSAPSGAACASRAGNPPASAPPANVRLARFRKSRRGVMASSHDDIRWTAFPSSRLYSFAQDLFDIVHLFAQEVQLAREALDFEFGAAIDVVIEFAAQAVLFVLPILTHHDHRRLDGGKHREEEVEQDKWVGVP